MGRDQAIGRHCSLIAAPTFGAYSKTPTQSWLDRLAARAASLASVHLTEKDMATFVLTLDWTDQGIRNVKEAPKRSEAAKALAKKVGVEIKEVYLTTGAHDILLLAEAPLGDHITKFALAVSSLGNVRTSTSRAWPEAEWTKLISELP
jgi:uncharacterized protein with GYD domain